MRDLEVMALQNANYQAQIGTTDFLGVVDVTHPIETKARAIALLITGNSQAHVSRLTGVPKQTISRWQVDAEQFMRDCLKTHPEYQTLVESGRRLRQSGSKKRQRRKL